MTEQEWAEYCLKDTLNYLAQVAVIYGGALAAYWILIG